MRAVTSMLTVSLLIPLAALSAQEPPPIEPGARVRVTARDFGLEKSVGTCLSLSQGAMAFEREGLSPLTIAVVSITGLEISRGRKSNDVKGALVGAWFGVTAGALLGAVWQSEHEYDCPEKALCIGVGAAALGVTGLIIGFTVGTFIKSERWEEVPLDRLRVNIVPLRDGRFALGLSVEF